MWATYCNTMSISAAPCCRLRRRPGRRRRRWPSATSCSASGRPTTCGCSRGEVMSLTLPLPISGRFARLQSFRLPVALLLPLALVNLVAFVLPVARLVQISFLEGHGGVLTDQVTLGNYLGFLTDTYYLGLIGNSIMLAAIVTVATLIVSYPI